MIKHLLKKALLLQFFLLLSCILFAQQKTVTGKVTDADGKPVSGVTVSIKGSAVGTTTDANGSFSIVVPANETVLKFSSAGFSYQELTVGSKNTISITMQKDTKQMEDVVVIGYGTQRARNITGAMASIDTKKIENLPVASLAEMLRGQVPGLNVSGGSTRPGLLAQVNVRQQFNWGKDGGGVIPLIVIDDVIQVDPQTGLPSLDRFNQLDLSEVESITVIKDAAAAIYGSRGSQGAVVIKTKRGKTGAPHITYNAKFETNNAVSHGKVMNARQYGDFSNKFQRALGSSADYQYSPTELASMDSLNYDWLGNDWNAANVMQHSLDFSGGSDRATYFTGGSYYTQGANLGTQTFKRWTYRAGTDVKLLSGLRFGATVAASNTNIAKSFTKINFSDGYAVGGEQNDYSVLLHMPKYIPWVYNVNGVDRYIAPALGPNRVGSVSGNNSLSNYNYYALLNNGSISTNKNFNYNANFSLQYDVPFVQGLSFKLNYGLSQAATNTEADMFPQLLYQATKINAVGKHLYSETAAADWTSTLNKSNTRVTYDNTTSKNEQTNFFVTYDKKFGDHTISVMASVEKATNMLEDRYQIYDNPAPDIYGGTSVSAGTLNTSNTITYRYAGGSLSYLGRLSYNYKSKYLLQFVFRTDASTVFAPENYWGTFPAVSAGWVISDEKFFRVPWVNFLKARIDIGKTGNNNISAWKWLQLYSAAADKGFGFGNNGGLFVTGLTPGVTPNRNVEWDNTLQRNFGIDASFLKNRLSVTLDQYFNSDRNMITDMSTALLSPITVGGAFAEQNFAAVNLWGTEISATWKGHIGREFNYSVGINTSVNNYKTQTYFDLPFAYPSTSTTRRALGNYGVVGVWGYRTWKETSAGDGMLRTDADIDNYWLI
ncbi:MAG: SusC/RagA family TonB-linked outer membrane protein [Ferruginibacter sp.]